MKPFGILVIIFWGTLAMGQTKEALIAEIHSGSECDETAVLKQIRATDKKLKDDEDVIAALFKRCPEAFFKSAQDANQINERAAKYGKKMISDIKLDILPGLEQKLQSGEVTQKQFYDITYKAGFMYGMTQLGCKKSIKTLCELSSQIKELMGRFEAISKSYKKGTGE